MKYIFKIVLFSLIMFMQFTQTFASPNQMMSPTQMHAWLKEALQYGFDMKTQDYTKYISTDYVEHIDGKVFNFKQWVHHMEGLKGMMKSYTLTFDEMVAEGNQIATSYIVHALKKNGSQLDIRIIAIFKIQNGKMIYCDELTHVLTGDEKDKEIGARD